MISNDCIEKICTTYERLFNRSLSPTCTDGNLAKCFIGLIEVARATGSSKAILTLISCMVKLQQNNIDDKSNETEKQSDGSIKTLQSKIIGLIEKFQHVQNTLHAFPRGPHFLNGPLPSHTNFPSIPPPSANHGQYNMSVICWLDYNNNHSTTDLNGAGEQWYSIKLYRSEDMHKNDRSLNPWVQYTLKFSSKDATIGIVAQYV